MKIAVLGTGMVGRALAARLDGLGHDVATGTRDVEQTRGRAETPGTDAKPYGSWQHEHPGVRLLSFPEAGAHAEVVINATSGTASLAALEAVGADRLAGKVLIDVALPLDDAPRGSRALTVANTDSLGEQIQRAFPEARVVKTLNTVFVGVMIDPSRVPGEHTVFVSGDDLDAKRTTTSILQQFGWPEASILDLGGIATARSVEMYAPLYFTLVNAIGGFDFNIAIRRA